MNILIVRLSAIGDIVMASGMIGCLKRTFKGVHIDWLVQSEYRELLEATSEIRRTVIWNRRRWEFLIKKWYFGEFFKELKDFFCELRFIEYDLVLDLQGLWKSAIWTLSAKGKRKILLDPKEHTRVFIKDAIFSPRSNEIASEYKFVLRSIGAYDGKYELGLKAFKEDEERADLLLREFGIDRDYVVFAPFTTRVQKMWMLEYWFEVAKKIEKCIVVLGGKKDRELAERLEKECDKVVSLAGKASLRESMCLVKKSTLLIGVDTGLTHMAMLSNVPAIAIFGATCPYTYTDNPKGVVLYNKYPCSPCKRSPVCDGRFDCMRSITPDMVISMSSKFLLSSCN